MQATLKRRDDRIREEARQEFARYAAAMEQARVGGQLASGPALTFSWQVDAVAFESTVIELMRRGDGLPLKLFFRRVAGEARSLIGPAGPTDDLELLLDRLAQIAGIALALEDDQAFGDSVAALLAIYRLTLNAQLTPTPARRTTSIPASAGSIPTGPSRCCGGSWMTKRPGDCSWQELPRRLQTRLSRRSHAWRSRRAGR
ncbi:hypothetical protein ACFYXL_05115 [Streptomyces tsukubensis]|uniref:hypothetical protein n=1 Tax=Streptomyces tsukubensis TaxID=83656 RepID=UPI0036AB0660